MYDILIVGAGLSGAVIARECANSGKKVLVIDQREHIAGNCYDYIDSSSGLLISKYGAHIFHTNNKRVWDYVNIYSSWNRYDHMVLSNINNRLVPIPVNINTINNIFNYHYNEQDINQWFSEHVEPYKTNNPANSEEVAISRVGKVLYSSMFDGYTRKQWDKSATELAPEVLARIPVRTNNDCRYFTDKWQALPSNGYTKLVSNILDSSNITIKLNTSFDDLESIEYKTLVFTGRIDNYFNNSGLEKLEYRSINFEWKYYPDMNYYQPCSVVNYPNTNVPYTRIVEYKHFNNQPLTNKGTVISIETTCADGEPYYPVPSAKNQELYNKYKELANKETNVHFIGRLASYKYFNMDQAILNALEYYDLYMAN